MADESNSGGSVRSPAGEHVPQGYQDAVARLLPQTEQEQVSVRCVRYSEDGCTTAPLRVNPSAPPRRTANSLNKCMSKLTVSFFALAVLARAEVHSFTLRQAIGLASWQNPDVARCG